MQDAHTADIQSPDSAHKGKSNGLQETALHPELEALLNTFELKPLFYHPHAPKPEDLLDATAFEAYGVIQLEEQWRAAGPLVKEVLKASDLEDSLLENFTPLAECLEGYFAENLDGSICVAPVQNYAVDQKSIPKVFSEERLRALLSELPTKLRDFLFFQVEAFLTTCNYILHNEDMPSAGERVLSFLNATIGMGWIPFGVTERTHVDKSGIQSQHTCICVITISAPRENDITLL